ncbi:MAG: class I SAM-dependent methyltransferase [Anaerolineae bacterium]|nr:class I SAM-dependent methyltransferase [Anaerolineae bacterium]
MDVRDFNRTAWDKQVDRGNPYTQPVTAEAIEAARHGEWQISLTDVTPVPRTWFPDDLRGVKVLGLAAGGGQQGPILAAAGATVTVFDNSPKQLAQDRRVADREGLPLTTVEGDMANLAVFADGSFDLIVHPISNVFVPDVNPVWAEAYRVLRPGGILLAGFMNPIEYIFDHHKLDSENVLEVRFSLPYSDLSSLTEAERQAYHGAETPLEFSHTFDDQIGGQLAAGFVITGFFEDYRQNELIGNYLPSFFATRAVKLDF